MSIPTPFNPMGTLGGSERVVTLGPYSESEVTSLSAERCITSVGEILVEAYGVGIGNLGGGERTAKALFAVNENYKPGYAETHLGGGGRYELSFSKPVQPLSIAFKKVDIRTERSLDVYTPEGELVAKLENKKGNNITFNLPFATKVHSFYMLSVNNTWFNGISIQVKV